MLRGLEYDEGREDIDDLGSEDEDGPPVSPIGCFLWLINGCG